MRLARVVEPATGVVFEFLINSFTFGPRTIARLYNDRWQVELFFKALKQHLHIRTVVGTSANAVHIQTWTALIAILLLKHLRFTLRLA